MQFFKDGPDVPEVLLEAHEDGKVVFFCGAGISYPAELPGFKGLVEGLYARLAVIPDAEQQAAMDSEQFDTAVALLEQKHPGERQQVREELSKILNPKSTDTKATATHRALLTLSENREGQRRLRKRYHVPATPFDRLLAEIVIRWSRPTLRRCQSLPGLGVFGPDGDPGADTELAYIEAVQGGTGTMTGIILRRKLPVDGAWWARMRAVAMARAQRFPHGESL